MNLPQATVVTFDGTTISVSATSIAEAKIAIRQMRVIKSDLSLQKKLLIVRQKEIRADYTAHVRTRGSMLRGGGGIGGIVRLFQTRSRDNHRSDLAIRLSPLDESKQLLERQILMIEGAILQVQSEMLKREV